MQLSTDRTPVVFKFNLPEGILDENDDNDRYYDVAQDKIVARDNVSVALKRKSSLRSEALNQSIVSAVSFSSAKEAKHTDWNAQSKFGLLQKTENENE